MKFSYLNFDYQVEIKVDAKSDFFYDVNGTTFVLIFQTLNGYSHYVGRFNHYGTIIINISYVIL